MPYRIDPRRNLGKELHALAVAQLDEAARTLDYRPDGLHAAIHLARKKFKLVRNLYRLFQAIDPDGCRRRNKRLRNIARDLSRLRDATALIETVDHLFGHVLNEDETRVLTEARTALSARRDRIAETEMDLHATVTNAAALCRIAIEEADILKTDATRGQAARQLARGWSKGLLRAKTAMDICKGEGHGEAFHDLRKAAQAYWMNLSLFRDLWPSAFAAKQSQAKSLVDLLGHENDLSVLTALIDEEPDLFGDGADQSFLLAIIIRRQQQLRREALSLAQTVFSDGPRNEALVIARLWRAGAK